MTELRDRVFIILAIIILLLVGYYDYATTIPVVASYERSSEL